MGLTLKERALRLGAVGLIVSLSILALYGADVIGSGSGGGAGIRNAKVLDPPRGVGQEDLEVGPQTGKLAPDFELSEMSGERHRLSNFRGKAVYINFWATWCVPCQVEMPDIQEVLDENDDRLVVVSVNRGESLERAQDFLRNIPRNDGGTGVDFTVNGMDPDDSLYDAYRGLGMPVSTFVDAEGVVTQVVNGLMSLDEMQEAVDRATH